MSSSSRPCSFLLLALLLACCLSSSSASRDLLTRCISTTCGLTCGPPQPGCFPLNGGGGGGYHPPSNGGWRPPHNGGWNPPPNNGWNPPPNNGWNPPPNNVWNPPPNNGGGQRPGCVGGLPFGLENCLCDGAEVGEVAGLAACSILASECLEFAAFSDNTVRAVQAVCDTFAFTGCKSAAQGALVINQGCGDIIRRGTSKCSPTQAKFIFDSNVDRQCAPLCPDCERPPPGFNGK